MVGLRGQVCPLRRRLGEEPFSIGKRSGVPSSTPCHVPRVAPREQSEGVHLLRPQPMDCFLLLAGLAHGRPSSHPLSCLQVPVQTGPKEKKAKLSSIGSLERARHPL